MKKWQEVSAGTSVRQVQPHRNGEENLKNTESALTIILNAAFTILTQFQHEVGHQGIDNIFAVITRDPLDLLKTESILWYHPIPRIRKIRVLFL